MTGRDILRAISEEIDAGDKAKDLLGRVWLCLGPYYQNHNQDAFKDDPKVWDEIGTFLGFDDSE